MEQISNLLWGVVTPEKLTSFADSASQFILTYGGKIILAVIVFWIGLKIINWLGSLIDALLERAKIDLSLKRFLDSLFTILLKIVLFIATIGIFGIEASSFLAIFGAAGLAVGLALQGSLSNFASGVLLLLFKPYKIGDVIEANGVKGTVENIEIFNTVLMSPEHRVITIPNSLITAGNIINFTRKGNVRVDVNVGISYSANIKEAKDILTKEVLEKNEFLSSIDGQGIFVSELADSSVNLIVRGFTSPAHYWDAYFTMIEEVKTALDNAGIEIPFPQRVIHNVIEETKVSKK